MSEATEQQTVEEAATTTPATITDDGTPSDGDTTIETPTEESAPASQAPETYELTAPEGVEFDQELLDMATPIFREAGLSNESAQKMVDLQLALQSKQEERLVAMEQEQHAEVKRQWGDDYKPMSQRVNALLNKFDPEKTLRAEMIGPYGLRDNPHLLSFLDRIAKAIGEDSTEGIPGGGGKNEPSIAERLYGGTGRRDVSDIAK